MKTRGRLEKGLGNADRTSWNRSQLGGCNTIRMAWSYGACLLILVSACIKSLLKCRLFFNTRLPVPIRWYRTIIGFPVNLEYCCDFCLSCLSNLVYIPFRDLVKISLLALGCKDIYLKYQSHVFRSSTRLRDSIKSIPEGIQLVNLGISEISYSK